MGWHYGLKLHLIVNYRKKIVATKLTQANVHDTKPFAELSRNLNGKLYGDIG